MNLFKKKDSNAKAKIIENQEAEHIVTDFKLTAPFASYRNIPYKDDPRFFDTFQLEIDDRLEALFKGEIDDMNANTLDDFIDDVARQTLVDLEKQQVSHHDFIDRFFVRRQTDKMHIEKQLNDLKEKLVKTEKQFEDANQRYENYRFSAGKGGKSNEKK